MSEKKLDAFKASAKQPTGPRQTKQTAAAAADEQEPTLGFARIEALLDQETQQSVHEQFASAQQQLQQMLAPGKDGKQRAAANRIRTAISHTLELTDYLFKVKEQLLQEFIAGQGASHEGAGKGKPAGKSPSPAKGGK